MAAASGPMRIAFEIHVELSQPAGLSQNATALRIAAMTIARPANALAGYQTSGRVSVMRVRIP